MASSIDSQCFICENSLSDGDIVLVKEKGIKTLLQSSIKRGNMNNKCFLRGLRKVSVHSACQKRYNNEKLIQAYLRHSRDSSKRNLRSNTDVFHFKDHCFYCGEEISDVFLKTQKKLPLSRRTIVRAVEMDKVKISVTKAAEKRGDEWGKKVIDRIENVTGLVAADAIYHDSCKKKFYKTPSTGEKRGYRPANNVDEAMQHIYSYLVENSDECQFSLDELMNVIKSDYRPDARTVKNHLFKKYKEDIVIAETSNKTSIVCFINTGKKTFTENWYKNKKKNPEEERIRIIETAAEIIGEDIRSKIYSTSEYPPSDQFLNNAESVIPVSLLAFFKSVILRNKKGSADKWIKQCIALSHAVISAVRPRSFLSSVLTGVSVYLYKKFGSRQLIDMLAALGFSSSYHETVLLEMSTVLRPQLVELNPSYFDVFLQFVFDNADFNVHTLDGYGTFHTMGGIMAVTPSDALNHEEVMNRLKKRSSSELLRQAGLITLQSFQKKQEAGLNAVEIKDLDSIYPLGNEIVPSSADILWLYGKVKNIALPGWSGFMEEATSTRDYKRSKIICLPFINAPPSQHHTVYTALLIASEKCKKFNQQTGFVTFDLPLYNKAQEIIHSVKNLDLNNVIVRLGGFHLLMSFMGAIGVIMAGSGLKELFACIFAQNSIDKIMSGHAYCRAVRAHLLTHQTLATLILENAEFSIEDQATLEKLLSDSNKSVVMSTDESEEFKTVKMKFCESITRLQNRGPTAQLWIQYFELVTLIKQFIEAERMGNWHLHLQTVKKMIPFFYAAGHLPYAKSAHLYLQDMSSLEERMDPTEYAQFTTEGYFTIRRSNKFWSGIWSDMTIEQTLMKNMKSIGGLTHGRGMTDSVLMRWTLGMVSLQNICEEMELFSGINSVTTDQHIDLRPTRISRDNKDVQKLKDWFSAHSPFPTTDMLMAISSGVVGSNKVNCHLSHKIGMAGVSMVIGKYFGSVKLTRKNRVITLASEVCSINVRNEKVLVDPLMLFQRMCLAKQSNEDLTNYFTYELAPYPMSLFTEDGMRKGTKSSLYAAFSPLSNMTELPTNRIVIVDGGFLLHKVVWNRSHTFYDICMDYVKFVKNNYGTKVMVIFDGYPHHSDMTSTKSAERLRRSCVSISNDVIFDKTTTTQVLQEKFLNNVNNKRNFISLLQIELQQANIDVKQAVEDADVLIVTSAISLVTQYDAVEIIGEDIDLLVLLTGLSMPSLPVYFRKPGRNSAPDKLFCASSYKNSTPKNVFLIHALSGCDTTSSLFGFGKNKFSTLFEKNPDMKEVADVFADSNASASKIVEAGERILVALYGGKTTQNFETLRYHIFSKSAPGKKFNLAKLPPTKDAAMYHFFRAYHQIQTWLGVQKNPLDWGWMKSNQGLIPLKTTRNPAPQSLLKFISCACKKGCSKACSCKKAGLKCSTICKNCCGICENSVDILLDDDAVDDPGHSFIEQIYEAEQLQPLGSQQPVSKKTTKRRKM